MRFADGKLGYVGSSWTSPGVFAVRVLGSKALAHFEMDLTRWAAPHLAHEGASLYVQRIAEGFGKREMLEVPRGDIFREELEMFAESCASGKPNELTAENGNVAVAAMCAALRSIEEGGRAVPLARLFEEAQRKASARTDSST
jgi:predicted dehydrogenase